MNSRNCLFNWEFNACAVIGRISARFALTVICFNCATVLAIGLLARAIGSLTLRNEDSTRLGNGILACSLDNIVQAKVALTPNVNVIAATNRRATLVLM